MKVLFDKRWGPASIIAGLALVFSAWNAFTDKSSAAAEKAVAVDKRVTVIEAQMPFVVDALKRIESKIDRMAGTPP